MAGYQFQVSGDYRKTMAFLQRAATIESTIRSVLQSAGQRGVDALSGATPAETGLAGHSWGFEVTGANGVWTLTWTNSDVENGFPVVIMLQYGHGTGTGGWVRGRDFINPAIAPIFDQIANDVWKAVTSI